LLAAAGRRRERGTCCLHWFKILCVGGRSLLRVWVGLRLGLPGPEWSSGRCFGSWAGGFSSRLGRTGVLGFPDPLTVHGAVVELPLRLEL
jgi:hypothetical protein